MGIAINANLTKVRDAKPRVLASSEKPHITPRRPKIAGLPHFSDEEMIMPGRNRLIDVLVAATAVLMSATLFAATPEEKAAELPADVYDEAAYTLYVEETMDTLDQLYLDFLDARGVDAAKARTIRKEFLATVHELMQHMNAKYDDLDLKKGAALSPTDTLVSVHAMTMLVDILASTELEQMAAHPYID
jgi:hypothetical protein